MSAILASPIVEDDRVNYDTRNLAILNPKTKKKLTGISLTILGTVMGIFAFKFNDLNNSGKLDYSYIGGTNAIISSSSVANNPLITSESDLILKSIILQDPNFQQDAQHIYDEVQNIYSLLNQARYCEVSQQSLEFVRRIYARYGSSLTVFEKRFLIRLLVMAHAVSPFDENILRDLIQLIQDEGTLPYSQYTAQLPDAQKIISSCEEA